MNKVAENKITVKIKLPNNKTIDVKTSSEATFKEFLKAAVEQNHKLKDFGNVKFEHRCNIWDINKSWVQAQDRLKQKQTLVFNKRTLAEECVSNINQNVPMGINSHLFIKDSDVLSLVRADDDPCAINLNDFYKINIRKCEIPETSIPKKINWPRIIVGIVALFLFIAAIITFILFLFNILTFVVIPVVCGTLFIVSLIIWATWNLFIGEDWRGGLIYKLDSSLNNEENMIDMNSYERDDNNMQLERYSGDSIE